MYGKEINIINTTNGGIKRVGNEVLGAQFNELMNSLEIQNEKEKKHEIKELETESLSSNESDNHSTNVFKNAMFRNFIMKEVLRSD